MNPIYIAAAIAVGALFGLWVLLAMCFRVVVSTNDVHIVQSAKQTVSYGKDQEAGNVYWKWPSWIPIVGVKTINLPVSVFSIDLPDYAGYDRGRVPFKVELLAFFRIEHPNIAAQRVHTVDELKEQLEGILQGATRSILAKAEIEEILEERAKYGQLFTAAVNDQLKSWGVINVKNIELMDIRDGDGSHVIQNIMAKKQSMVERDSRVAVAENQRAAKEAEIVATREVELASQQAAQQVGQRKAEAEKQIGIANEQSKQEVLTQARETTTKQMDVSRVQEVRKAEISREVKIVQADQDKQTAIIEAEQAKQTAVIKAEGQKQQTITVAEGDLSKAQMNAQGVKAEGEAKGSALQAELMAPVNAQTKLAETIGNNKEYQTYLIEIRKVEMAEVVGKEQALALQGAEIKVIANTGEGVPGGVTKVMELFSAKGGTTLGAMVEALKQTEGGAAIVERFTNGNGR